MSYRKELYKVIGDRTLLITAASIDGAECWGRGQLIFDKAKVSLELSHDLGEGSDIQCKTTGPIRQSIADEVLQWVKKNNPEVLAHLIAVAELPTGRE